MRNYPTHEPASWQRCRHRDRDAAQTRWCHDAYYNPTTTTTDSKKLPTPLGTSTSNQLDMIITHSSLIMIICQSAPSTVTDPSKKVWRLVVLGVLGKGVDGWWWWWAVAWSCNSLVNGEGVVDGGWWIGWWVVGMVIITNPNCLNQLWTYLQYVT